MKIAVATNDQKRVTGHIGKCKSFMVYEIEGQKIINKELRENLFTNHRMHEHNHHEHHGGGNDHHEHHGNGDGHNHHEHHSGGGHSHLHLIEGLKDCEYLISKGGGWRVVEDLKRYNIKTLFADEELIEDAVNKFIKGELKNDEYLTCDHGENNT
jgi:predicted Fe-Mo cluster-binding NifX family protein